MKQKKGFRGILISILIVAIIAILSLAFSNTMSDGEFVQAKREKELEKRLAYRELSDFENFSIRMLTMPVSLVKALDDTRYYGSLDYSVKGYPMINSTTTDIAEAAGTGSSNVNEDHSNTNVQVKNVDEADTTKTDGEYIYSISENLVVVTKANPVSEMKVVEKLNVSNGAYPSDLLLYGEKLIVLSQQTNLNSHEETVVDIFDISNKEKISKIHTYTFEDTYKSVRATMGTMYLVLNKSLTYNYYNANDYDKDTNLIPSYYMDGKFVEGNASDFYYRKEEKIKERTDIVTFNLDDGSLKEMKAYAIDSENMYMSEDNLYIVETSNSSYDSYPTLKDIFGLSGIFGLIKQYNDYDYKTYTEIYKFELSDIGANIVANNKIEGRTLNQFSMDEYEGNLRISTSDDESNNIYVLDEYLNIIGTIEDIAPGEKIYATRFEGEKAYLVTYKNTDPLFVIDLSNPENPCIKGELKIPGYSTYLHTYDENNLIGIGIETEEKVRKDDEGKVIGTSVRTIGLKIALFDISDMSNPVLKSNVILKGENVYSPILKNHKALLFSKEKGILAIPITNYDNLEENDTEANADDIESLVDSYYVGNRVSKEKGYVVYDINKEEIKEKGIIKSEEMAENGVQSYLYPNPIYGKYTTVRGAFIGNTLYTISDKIIKANDITTLAEIKTLNLVNGGTK